MICERIKMLFFELHAVKVILFAYIALFKVSRSTGTLVSDDLSIRDCKNNNYTGNFSTDLCSHGISHSSNETSTKLKPDANCTLPANIGNMNDTTLQTTLIFGNELNIVDGNNNATSHELSINGTLCFDDNLPCNLSREEYMEYLYDYLRPETIKWILIISHSVVFLIGLIGNALVCLAVYANYSMRTVTNIFIVNLAVADFLVILVCLPPSVVWDITETWFLGETMCKIVLYFQTVSVTVSVLTLTLISIDRWYAICFPLRYRTKISRAMTLISIIWIFAFTSDIPEFLALTVRRQKLRFDSILFSQCVTTWSASAERNFYMIQLVLLFIFPLLLMIAAYFKIACVLWKSDAILGHHVNSQRATSSNPRSSVAAVNRSAMGQLQARRKAAKMMVVVVIMFAVCYSPVHIFNLLRYTGKLQVGEITKIFALCSHWLCYANSAINPVIYNFMSGKFRREFRNVIARCRCSSIRIEDNYVYKNARHQNNSMSMRSYHNLSVRDFTKLPYVNPDSVKKSDSNL